MITFSSCFYIIKSKFDASTYVYWMNNFISIVNHFNLVIYTDKDSLKYIDTKGNPRIKVILKPLENFHNYQYKDYWIKNHSKNIYFNHESSYNTNWELNMLWSEKVWFVNETVNNRYYDTAFYGWCDIGYFRNSNGDINTCELSNWPNKSTIEMLNKSKIHYACIQNSDIYLGYLKTLINNLIGYDLSDSIEMITSWYELDSGGQRLFTDGKQEFNWLLNHYGPMFLFNVNGDNYYVQPQGKEYGTLVLSDKKNRKIDEDDFLKILGLNILGISLNDLINEFVIE
jgi:hypothetical protein